MSTRQRAHRCVLAAFSLGFILILHGCRSPEITLGEYTREHGSPVVVATSVAMHGNRIELKGAHRFDERRVLARNTPCFLIYPEDRHADAELREAIEKSRGSIVPSKRGSEGTNYKPFTLRVVKLDGAGIYRGDFEVEVTEIRAAAR
jgi:hypothetical protein